MTPVDNLRVGHFICVSGDKRIADSYSDGEPYQIMAIDLPFMALMTRDGTVNGIDTRVYALKRVSKRYWLAFIDMPSRHDQSGDNEDIDDYPRCIRCGERLTQSFIDNEWRHFCRACNRDYDLVT